MALCQNYIYDGEVRCCEPIICPPGTEAVICTAGEPETSDCQPCDHDKYRPDQSILGRPDYCKLKRQCTGPYMVYERQGNATHDNVCGCEHGYMLSQDSTTCYPASWPGATTTEPTALDATQQTTPYTLVIILLAVLVLVGIIIVILVYVCKRRRRSAARRLARTYANGNAGPTNGHTGPTHHQPLLYSQQFGNEKLMGRIRDVEQTSADNLDFNEKALNIAKNVISRKIGKHWKTFCTGMFHAVNKDDVWNTLEADLNEDGVENKVFTAITRWHQGQGRRDSNVAILLRVLVNCQRADLVEDIYTKCMENADVNGNRSETTV